MYMHLMIHQLHPIVLSQNASEQIEKIFLIFRKVRTTALTTTNNIKRSNTSRFCIFGEMSVQFH